VAIRTGAIRAGTVGLPGFAVIALGLALAAPLGTSAIALMIFGVLHNVLELRYLGGRYGGLLTGNLLRLLLVLITGIVLIRLGGAVLGLRWQVPAEIVLTYAILTAAVWPGVRRSQRISISAAALLAAGLVASLSWPSYHVVVITHLHNVVPLAFLWEFSRSFPGRARTKFRYIQLGWLIVVPSLILVGLLDRWLASDPSGVRLFAAIPTSVTTSTILPGTLETTIGTRFLTVFAFLQVMHYAIWVFYLPRYSPAATAAFEQRMPALRGGRIWAVGLVLGGLLLLLFLTDYGQGRTVYTALASYHAYLELPVLAAMLLGLSTTGNANPISVTAHPVPD
jgi:hypothetical protein